MRRSRSGGRTSTTSQLDPEELFESDRGIGGLELAGEPVPAKQSLVYTLRFPPQEHKIGGRGVDPGDREALPRLGRRRARARHACAERRSATDEPLPRALIPPSRSPTTGAARRGAALRRGAGASTRRSSRSWSGGRRARELGGRRGRGGCEPRGQLPVRPGAAGLGEDVARGARGDRADAAGAAGRRHFAEPQGDPQVPRGCRAAPRSRRASSSRAARSAATSGETEYEDEFVDCTSTTARCSTTSCSCSPGTSFLFSREEMDRHVDTLFVDEAGQVALADVLAVGTAARNIVLLGDPNQLAQVSQGSHPPGAEASVLRHLLGADETLRPEMGLFLEETWRMRPEVNAVHLGVVLRGRLDLGGGDAGAVARRRQRHPLPAGRARGQPDAVAGGGGGDRGRGRAAARRRRTEDEARRARLRHEDVIVVAPYNAHVRCLREKLPDGVARRDRRQVPGPAGAGRLLRDGRARAREDVPRGLDFLFSRNRLNVAISRAQCLAYLVCSPRLLDANCRTVEQMRLANALCRFVEDAEGANGRELVNHGSQP